jgi:hypothetical protein
VQDDETRQNRPASKRQRPHEPRGTSGNCKRA